MMERKRPTKVVKTVKKDEPMNVAKKLVGKQMSHVLRGESDARVVRMSTYSTTTYTYKH
jgi:3-methyladenine DNA glycosylase Mpg